MSSLKNNKRMLDESQDYMELEFIKMHGIGNDFVILDDRKGNIVQYENYSILAKKLCSRRFGIGADGIVLILDSKDHDIKVSKVKGDIEFIQRFVNGDWNPDDFLILPPHHSVIASGDEKIIIVSQEVKYG